MQLRVPSAGGHVECLEAGVFRSDLPCKFKLQRAAFQKLLDEARFRAMPKRPFSGA